jgi:hypothetical protein
MDEDVEKRFDKVDSKLEKVDDNLGEIKEVLVKQQVILDDHVKRTTNLESRVDPLEKWFERMKGAFKLMCWIGAFLVGFAAIAESISFILANFHK